MILRKLEREEHIKTRKLWEEIFIQDTKEFLDYYYSVKTLENEIYVVEQDGEIVSMLHLNPYQMRIKDKLYPTHYVVAVATDEKYRKRGYMAALLKHAMQVMKDRGEPITFLMPAAEAIYKPFGFKFIYEQEQGRVQGKVCTEENIEFKFATKEDCVGIAEFANRKLQGYDVVTWRNASYYETLLEEQKSENGGILLIKREGKIEGVFCYAQNFSKAEQNLTGQHMNRSHIEIREPLFDKKEDLQYAVCCLTGNEIDEVFCTGYGEETKPMIMAKALQPEFEDIIKNFEVFINEVV